MGFFSVPKCPSCARHLAGGSLQQIRGKKRLPKTPTIPVRLTRDVPKFGGIGTILQIPRGRMREAWYPQGIADYVTASEMKKIPVNAIMQRDPTFMLKVEKKKAKIEINLLTPTQTITLLESFLPPALVFSRPTISPNEPTIHGSITTGDIATAIRAIAAANGKEGSRVVVGAEHISFADKSIEGDKLKAIGTVDFEITMKGSTDFVRRKVVIMKQLE